MLSVDPRIPRTALITGGAKRLGCAMVEALATDGWSVAIHCHQSDREANDLASKIVDNGGKAVVVQADLSDMSAVQNLMPQVTQALGPLGLLINNASSFSLDSLESATQDSWDHHLQPNLQAPFFLSQAFARQLPDETHGLILNMLDQRVWNPTPYFTTYTISKSALWSLTQTLALALGPRIRVCGIGPGPTLPTPRQTAEDFDRQCRATPLQHGTSPEEVVMTMRFLLAATSITGQMIALDGGQHLGWVTEERLLDACSAEEALHGRVANAPHQSTERE